MSILVVGSLHLDVVLSAPHLPALDETVTGTNVDYVFGGKGGNQALAAKRMGADVHFAGRVGQDRFGDMVLETLQGSGMVLDQLQLDDGPTGMSAAIVDATGGYGAVIVSAANLNIDADLISVPPGTTIVLLQNEIPEPVNVAIARKAKTAGAQVWLNAAPARPLSKAMNETLDLLIVNRVEAAFYNDALPDVDVLTTLGADGATFHGRNHAAYAVEVISTHGAGDMFVGALAAEVDRGASIDQAIGQAQAAAALHVSSDLDARALIDWAAVDAFASHATSNTIV